MFTSYGQIKKPKNNYRIFADFSLIVSLYLISKMSEWPRPSQFRLPNKVQESYIR